MANTVGYLPDRGFWKPEGYKLEAQLQSACALWFWNTHIRYRRTLFHVDNNSWNAVVGAQKKSLGVVAGPSDFIFIADKVYFLEMKLPGHQQSPEQWDFMNKVLALGHEYWIIEYFAQFRNFINNKLKITYG